MQKKLPISPIIHAIFFFSFILLFQCQLADLRSSDWIGKEPDAESQTKGREILTKPLEPGLSPSKWSRVEGLDLYLIDTWNSSLVRFFTPIPERAQAMKVRLSWKTGNISAQFTDGKQRGKIIGLEAGEPYIIEPELGKVTLKDNEIKTYLESLHLYLTLPFLSTEWKRVAYIGDVGIGEKRYHEIFATNGPWEPNSEYDQYKIYMEQQFGYIEFVSFTYRDVFDSYVGVLNYQEYTNLNGRMYPMKITVQDRLLDDSYVHTLQVGTVKFLLSEPEFEE
jgi:hypothetical protein